MEDVRIKLSVLWIAHFLIWTFGDVVRIIHPGYIQELMDEPISEDLLLFVAVPLGIIQTIMILLPVMWDDGKIIRWANLAAGILFFVINVGYVIDIFVSEMPSWEYLLAVVYLLIAALVIKTAWEWTPEIGPE
jgi:hypothetical protein